MTAKEVKCPLDGTGVWDVAPDYDFADQGPLPVATASDTLCHCQNGHPLMVRVKFGLEGLKVSVVVAAGFPQKKPEPQP